MPWRRPSSWRRLPGARGTPQGNKRSGVNNPCGTCIRLLVHRPNLMRTMHTGTAFLTANHLFDGRRSRLLWRS
jgi:hypothetical protein